MADSYRFTPPAASTTPAAPRSGIGGFFNSLTSGSGGGGLGDAFGRLAGGNKPGAAKDVPGGAAPISASQQPFVSLETPQRNALLQAMLQRARGGQAGGAPNAPLPAPNSNVPTA
jgi:hypothetical protein